MRATFEVLPNQADAIETDARFSAMYGGVGSGKTFAAQWKMWRRLRKYPRAGHYVVGADFEQLRGGYFLDFRELLEELLRWREGRDYRYRETPRPTIILNDTGARLRALSSELAERIRSTRIHSLHGEEPQTWHHGHDVWLTLVGRMRHSVLTAKLYPKMQFQAWLTFNPGGKPGAPVGSWLHEMVTRAWPKLGYPSWRFSLRDNYMLHGLDQTIENLEQQYPPHLWPVEIDGNFPTQGGQVYRAYDRKLHATPLDGLPPLAFDPALPLCWSLDFNVALMCSVMFQIRHQQRVIVGHKDDAGKTPIMERAVKAAQEKLFYFLGELRIPDASMYEVVPKFIAWFRSLGDVAANTEVHLYGDSTGGNRGQQTNETNWDIAVQLLRAAGIKVVKMVRKNPLEWDRVNAFNAQLVSGDGVGVYIDHDRCPYFVRDLQGVGYKEGTNDIDKRRDPLLTHLSDAGGYPIYQERNVREVTWGKISTLRPLQ